MTRPASAGRLRSPVDLLPAGTASLARGIPDSPTGTLFVLGDRGGIRVAPTERFQVLFGRNEPEVHVCVGIDDPGVSRRHGLLSWATHGWTLRNTGTVPIRFPGSRLLLTGQEEPLGSTYLPLFIRTEPGREHLLELRVAGTRRTRSRAAVDDATRTPPTWSLSDRERLVLAALGESYLRHEAHPRPASWATTAAQLVELQPDAGWTARSVEWVVGTVRRRLVDAGITGLTREEVGEPLGNALNHNLLIELLVTTSLVPPDLRLLEHGGLHA